MLIITQYRERNLLFYIDNVSRKEAKSLIKHNKVKKAENLK